MKYPFTSPVKRSVSLLIGAFFAITVMTSPILVWAAPEPPSTPDDIKSFVTNTAWYDPSAQGNCVAPGGSGIETSEAEAANAQIVIGIAKTLNLGQQGALIGLMTAVTESGLKNYANETIPESKQNPSWLALAEPRPLGFDHDSVGIMQQRVSTGWSTFGNYTYGANPEKDRQITWQLMNPAYAAQAFFGTPNNMRLPDNLENPGALRKGLINLPGDWRTMDPGAAAQAVQISAFPDAYSRNRIRAEALLNKYWASSPPITLPIPITTSDVEGDIAPDSVENACIFGGSTAILQKINEYAWPDYRPANTPAGLAKKPAYQAAVNRSPYKGGCDGIDCGAFVTIVMRESGADPQYNTDINGEIKSYYNTKYQLDYLRRNSGAPGEGKKYTRVMSKDDLRPGDIAIRDTNYPFLGLPGHTFFFVGTAMSEINPNWTGGQSASSSFCERAPMASGTDTFELYEWYHLNY